MEWIQGWKVWGVGLPGKEGWGQMLLQMVYNDKAYALTLYGAAWWVWTRCSVLLALLRLVGPEQIYNVRLYTYICVLKIISSMI